MVCNEAPNKARKRKAPRKGRFVKFVDPGYRRRQVVPFWEGQVRYSAP